MHQCSTQLYFSIAHISGISRQLDHISISSQKLLLAVKAELSSSWWKLIVWCGPQDWQHFGQWYCFLWLKFKQEFTSFLMNLTVWKTGHNLFDTAVHCLLFTSPHFLISRWHWEVFKKHSHSANLEILKVHFLHSAWLHFESGNIFAWSKRSFSMEKKYTHITSSEQGTVGLCHVHVVVVILELWMKDKKSTLSLLVSIISCATQALPAFIMDTRHSHTVSHSALNVYTQI